MSSHVLRLTLPLGLLLSSAAFAQPTPRRLEFRTWYPGFLPGHWSRTTVSVTLLDGGRAQLEAMTERPVDPAERERFNARGFELDARSR